MGSMRLDLSGKICTEQFDHFDRLPDSLVLLIFNRIGDVKALGRCGVVSRRFHLLVPQVDNVIVWVDCVISNDDSASSIATSSGSATADKSRNPLITSSLHRHPLSSNSKDLNFDSDQNSVTHHSPTQVLRNFNEIKLLRIELPSGEHGIDEGILLKWKADFGSTLDNCVILGASSVSQIAKSNEFSGACNVKNDNNGNNTGAENDSGSIPESFYTNGGLKLRVVWTISSLIAASARHYLLQPIIAEHKTLKSLVLRDADGQGVLSMNKEQLEELRVKPLSASSVSKGTLVPALNMHLWYASHLELPNGMVLKGATLVAIRPSFLMVVVDEQ
ncbi:F-box protein [Forsythia ovata]|uniref:F-box protein n=1 Tax=Forsythia ovata TaxID=205694 RepID=A0ABD1SNL6_9LAMI